MISPVPGALTVATYVALLFSIVGLWFNRAAWLAAFIAAIALGYAGGVLSGPAAVWIALLASCCVLYRRNKLAPRTLQTRIFMSAAVAGIVILSTLLGMHALPGFNNFRIAQGIVLSPGAAPYSLYLNFDKTVAGVLILGLVYESVMQTWKAWSRALTRAAPVIFANILVLVALALPLGYLRFDPKAPGFFWIWALVNLFFTCLAEEAFFRAFLQQELSIALAGRARYRWIPVVASAVLFGLAHFAGGWTYVFLAALAGTGYALVFQWTRRVEMSMLSHFALNTTHFLLFTYPASA